MKRKRVTIRGLGHERICVAIVVGFGMGERKDCDFGKAWIFPESPEGTALSIP